MARLYFVLTRQCNLRCRHCYLSAEPEHKDTTISEENFKKAIDHIPEESRLELTLSGGEPFTIKNKLFNFLEYIQEKNLTRACVGQNSFSLGL